MAIAILSAILQKMRRMIGSPSSLQITDSNLEDFVNSFYLYDFPAQFRSLKLKDMYTFNTIQGIDTYAFDSERYTTVQAPCYCMKRPIALLEDPWSFYGLNFNWQTQSNFATGNGTTGPYIATLSSIPLLRSVNNNSALLSYPASRVQNVLITCNTTTSTLNVTDDGNGNLIGDATSGTIDYITGVIANLKFTSIVPQGNQIQIQYNPVQTSIPLSILFFQNQFTLRPVPDQGYTVELTAYRQPTHVLRDTAMGLGTPELNEWWETIAVGAAKKFFEDTLDMENMALMEQLLAGKYALNNTRTYAQLGKQRVATIYADQLSNTSQSNGFFGSIGG